MVNFIKRFLNRNKATKYESCVFIQSGVTFMHKVLKTCSQNKGGIIFIDKY